ncbi:MAG: nucleotide-binding protein [Candidatus Brocadiaceae bacterium]|nr:nucleotide-binding protein [Candidatus Brocadiaceae bacterium]
MEKDIESSKMKIFIGYASSGKSKNAAEYIENALTQKYSPLLWDEDIRPGESILGALTKQAHETDFACFICDRQDTIIIDGVEKKYPNSNVLFEIGLFSGVLGRERVFMVFPKGEKPDVPTDLNGIIMLPENPKIWQEDVINDKLAKRVGYQMSNTMNQIGPFIEDNLDAMINELVRTDKPMDESLALGIFHRSLPHFMRDVARKVVPRGINLVCFARDILLYVRNPFDIQDITELTRVQGNLPDIREIWVFAMEFLDLNELYKTVETNLTKGMRYVYFQHDPERFEILKEKLEDGIKEKFKKDIKTLSEDETKELVNKEMRDYSLICICVDREVLMPCDYLIYHPSATRQKGYIGKSSDTNEKLYVELSPSHVNETVRLYERYVRDAWRENEGNREKDVFKYPRT